MMVYIWNGVRISGFGVKDFQDIIFVCESPCKSHKVRARLVKLIKACLSLSVRVIFIALIRS